LIKREPTDPGLHYHLALAQLARLDKSAALRAIREAIRLKRDVPDFYALLAIILRASNRLDDALIAVQQGIEIAPENIALIQALGDLYNIRGDIDKGIALVKPHIERAGDRSQFLVVLADLYLSANRHEDALEILKKAAAIPGLSGQPASWVHLHIGMVEEKLGQYDTAWRHYKIGNRYRGTVFHPDAHDALIDQGIRIWNAERLASLPRAKNRKAEQMVFIVGMPRSGTSLVEQILASHPDVYGGGELNFISGAGVELFTPTVKHPTVEALLDNLRQPVIDRQSQKTQKLMTVSAPRAKRFIDKLPQNFLHLGLIELLFPQARIINCLRDPRDVCLSCHTKLFGGGNSQPFSGDLTHLGRYYRAYDRKMEHWRRVSTLPIFSAVYEEGVQDLESYARQLVDFLGLPWDDACLRFWETKRDVITASTDQVRRPIYTSSIGRWRHFTDYLGPLFDALEMGPEAEWPPA
ncbi:hypothetical protein MNBD_PLANCTO03-1777, partial [hydrothermal vent metagenome]